MDDAADPPEAHEDRPLRRGWTAGACATAAPRSALAAPRGDGSAEAGIIKDAGDDPDVTHGALVIARVTRGAKGEGISFHAGDGVGTVPKPGLPLAVGEPA